MKPEDGYTILETQYFGEDIHEKDEIENLPSVLADTKLFVDVGASLGQYTFYANKVLRGAKIIAVEADPLRFTRLKELCSTWTTESSNQIVAVHGAVSDVDGEISFYTTDSNVSGAINKLDNRADEEQRKGMRKITVPSFTLDKLLADESAQGVIKIDVEGGEHRVLLGAPQVLKCGRYRFMVELHSWGDPSLGVGPKETMKLFKSHLYDSKKLHNHYLFYPVASRFHLLFNGLRRFLNRNLNRLLPGK